MNSLETLTVEEWDSRYKPMTNVLDPNASWDGVMFETYGEEHNTVRKYPNNRVWTYIDGDNGTYLIAGYHIVNRIGYFICEVPWEHENIQVLVKLDEHLKDLSIDELAEVFCEECGINAMDTYACIVAMKNNEALCVECCGDCI